MIGILGIYGGHRRRKGLGMGYVRSPHPPPSHIFEVYIQGFCVLYDPPPLPRSPSASLCFVLKRMRGQSLYDQGKQNKYAPPPPLLLSTFCLIPLLFLLIRSLAFFNFQPSFPLSFFASGPFQGIPPGSAQRTARPV